MEKLGEKTDAGILLALEEEGMALASAMAAARSLPLYDRKTGASRQRRISLAALGPQGLVQDPRLAIGVEALCEAARLVDTPTRELLE